MSLRYYLLGIPKTVAEFLDRESKLNNDSIDLIVERHGVDIGGVAWEEYHAKVYIQSSQGNRKKQVAKFMTYPFLNNGEALIGQCLSFYKEKVERQKFQVKVLGYDKTLEPYDPKKVEKLKPQDPFSGLT